jgi:hypothetical protein
LARAWDIKVGLVGFVWIDDLLRGRAAKAGDEPQQGATASGPVVIDDRFTHCVEAALVPAGLCGGQDNLIGLQGGRDHHALVGCTATLVAVGFQAAGGLGFGDQEPAASERDEIALGDTGTAGSELDFADVGVAAAGFAAQFVAACRRAGRPRPKRSR